MVSMYIINKMAALKMISNHDNVLNHSPFTTPFQFANDKTKQAFLKMCMDIQSRINRINPDKLWLKTCRDSLVHKRMVMSDGVEFLTASSGLIVRVGEHRSGPFIPCEQMITLLTERLDNLVPAPVINVDTRRLSRCA